MKKKIYVEVFDSRKGDTDYELSKEFSTYQKAQRYAVKVSKKTTGSQYIFIYVPKNDGCSDYQRREDWTKGKHNKWLDEDIY